MHFIIVIFVNPYFGGLASCRDIAQGLNISDFVCSPCSGIGEENVNPW